MTYISPFKDDLNSNTTPTNTGYKSPFGIQKTTPIVSTPQTKTSYISPWLGGGAYTTQIGQPNTLVKTGGSTGHNEGSPTAYGGVKEIPGNERADIVPVSLGGVNSDKANISPQVLIPENQRDKPVNLTEADKYLNNEVLPAYKAGKLSLPQARLAVLTFQQQHYDSKGQYHADAGVDTGNGKWNSTKTNFINGVKDVASGAFSAVKNLITPKKPQVFPVYTPEQQANLQNFTNQPTTPTPLTATNIIKPAYDNPSAINQRLVSGVEAGLAKGLTNKQAIAQAQSEQTANIAMGFLGGGMEDDIVKTLAKTTDKAVVSDILKSIGVRDDLRPQ